MTKVLLLGNEAFARGAYEAGITLAAAYPGTPSTETLQNIADKYKDVIFAEWAPNEKVAFEVAAGAALTGARALAVMKHVGLNVAADPLMTLSYTGVVGAFVAMVADDPGMHSSQNEQDTRHYARFAKIPILEPSDSQEAKDFIKLAVEISEEFNVPVIVRSGTRISHSRTLVAEEPRQESDKPIHFEKNPPRFVPIPLWARPMRVKVEERLNKLRKYAETCSANKIIWQDTKLGIITNGVAYQYVREVFPEASVLKLGMSYPFPDALIREFAAGVEEILVVEELEDILEQHIKAMGIACRGKDVVPNIGELSPDALLKAAKKPPVAPPPELPFTMPMRPPVLCAGCPHRGVFYALTRIDDVIVAGDIGCYSLGVFPPLSGMDMIICMGGGVTLAHGVNMAQRNNEKPQKIVGMVGDSTFFHSGVTGLMDIAYNKGSSTIIVCDNRTTAMTGHQDHPGTGKTLMGEDTIIASIPEIGKACGYKNVKTVDPNDIKATIAVLKEATESPDPWLVVTEAPCPLHKRAVLGSPLTITEKCTNCKICLKLGCPGLEKFGDEVKINVHLCAGCKMCQSICPAKAIV